MAIGDILSQETNPQIRNALAQAMAPQQVRSGGMGGIGAVLQQIQQNPAAIQMLLSTGSKLLNPTTFQRPGGRIADAVSSGVSGYNELKTAQEDKEYKRQMLERQQDREDRKVDLTEESMDNEMTQWADQFSLSKEELAAKKKLWEAQMNKYGAEARALRAKAEGTAAADLTGPERIINNLAKIYEDAGVPSNQAYTMALDVYNKSGESRAKAIAGTYESLALIGTDEQGKQLLDNIIEKIDALFTTSTSELENAQRNNVTTQNTPPEAQEIAPNVTMTDVNAALQAINQNDGTNLTWDQLTDMQRDRLIKAIQDRKGGGQ